MAAGGNPDNVSLGAGRVYVAVLGTAEPSAADSALPSAWRAIGYTEDGTTVTIEVTNEEIEVAEEYDPILYVNTKRTTMVSIQMAEATRRNLALALGTGPSEINDDTAYEPPTPGEEARFMLIWDYKDSPTDPDNIRWLFRKCSVAGTIEIQRNKAPNKALLPVEISVEKPSGAQSFKVYPDPTGRI